MVFLIGSVRKKLQRVGYTFEFGRKHKAGNKGLNNSDTDSGIINMQR